ncbi:transposase [Nonomuraea recticatena]|uniref:transposase n=1 Tax=Nonomuraea recticatena TaxID=46178 RepID=UPI0036079541
MTYLRGLLLDGRESMQPMAERPGVDHVDHPGLQQFVTTSAWDTWAVRARLARTVQSTSCGRWRGW